METITKNADKMFFCSPSIVIHSQFSNTNSREFSSGVYMLTKVPSCDFTSISAISQYGYYQYSFASQCIVISLANEMFKESKPMIGEELELLKKTYRRLLKNTPTSFKK